MAATSVASRLPAWLRAHAWRLAALFLCVLAPLWLFGEIAEEVGELDSARGLGWDETILLYLRSQSGPVLDRLMLGISTISAGPWVATVDVAVFVFLWAARRQLDALFWAFATGGAALLNVAAKHGYARIRPDLWPSIAPELSYSFPSGHTMQSMALAAAAVALLWSTPARGWAIAVGAAFTGLVGLSRVYLGVHFPSDVAAGWAASLAWVVGLRLVFDHRAARRRRDA